MNTKWLYSLLLITQITMPLYGFAHPLIENATTYDELRQAFKHACKLEDVMSEFDFLYFIEPYIKEAETSLPAFAYCLQHPEKEICKIYLQELAASFNYHLESCVTSNSLVMPYNYSDGQGVKGKACIPHTLVALEQEAGLESLEAWKEFHQTGTLINHMCARFYRELSLGQKIRIKRAAQDDDFFSRLYRPLCAALCKTILRFVNP